ncbi:hypothetical protein [Streptomyces sp. NPDC006527]|uniref:hypothetical protein n=1 Tax=Streptomyces sp. NPDC006527 TaxID=3364749 RepID=UPI00369CC3F3
MKRFIKRMSVVAASAAIAGGAVLATGGTASAVTSDGPRHLVSSSVHNENRDGHDRDMRGEHDDGRDGQRDHYRAWRYDHDHRGYDRSWHHTTQYHWDGHRQFRLMDGRWADVTDYGHGATERWYVDQVFAFER